MLSSISIIFMLKMHVFLPVMYFGTKNRPRQKSGAYFIRFYIILFTLLQPKLASYGGHLLQRNIY